MPLRSQAIAKAIRYSPQTDCKGLKTQLKNMENLEGYGEDSCCLTRALNHSGYCSSHQKFLCMLSKEKGEHKSSYNPPIYSGVLTTNYVSTMVAQNLDE